MSNPASSDIRFNCPEDGEWVARRCGCTYDPRSDIVIARPEKGGMIYSGWTGVSMFCHFAGEGHWITRDLLWVGFHYPFVQLGCAQIYGLTPSTKPHALRVNHKLGFREVARLPGAIPRGDLVIVCMRREDCRWLKLTPRQLVAPQKGRNVNGSLQS